MLFKGNLRGDPAAAYAKLTQRLGVGAAPAAPLALRPWHASADSAASNAACKCCGARVCRAIQQAMHARSQPPNASLLPPCSAFKQFLLQEELGEQYKLYLLEDQEERPVSPCC